MADFDVSKFRTTSFMTIWDLLKDVLVNMVKWFDGTTDTNLPVGTKRWSSSNKRFEQWDGSAWGELLPVADSANAYQIRVAMANACSGSTATADLATNALNLGGVAASQYVQTTDTRMSDSRKCNGQFDSAGTARTALSVYSKTEMNNSMALKAPVLNPAFSGTPTAPTAAAGTKTTQIATTAFVSENTLVFGAPILLNQYLNSGWVGTFGEATFLSFAVPIYRNGVLIALDLTVQCLAPYNEAGINKTAFEITSTDNQLLHDFAEAMGYSLTVYGASWYGAVTVSIGYENSAMTIKVSVGGTVTGTGMNFQARVFATSRM